MEMEDDNIQRNTYLAIDDGAFGAPVPYHASVDLRRCSPWHTRKYISLLSDLRARHLLKITLKDECHIGWNLTPQGVEFVERAGLVYLETAEYHRMARIALIKTFLGETVFTTCDHKVRPGCYKSFTPEVLAGNVLFLYEGRCR